jgi:dTDP-glucose pyrophosphorylase
LKKKNFSLNIRILDINKDDKTQKVIEIAKKFVFQDKLLVILGDNYHNNFNLVDFIYYHNTSNSGLSIVVKSKEIPETY